MATKWSAVSISNYGAASPADDGTATEANKVKYSTIKTDLTNPLNTALTSALSGLTEAFNDGTIAKSGTYSTTATDHARTIECTSTFTLSLLAAATAGAGYKVTVKNAGTGIITVARSSTDTIDGATSFILYQKESATFVVNQAGTGYDMIGPGKGLVMIETLTASASASLSFATGIDSTHNHYILVCKGLTPATDDVQFWARVATSLVGPTWASGVGAYQWAGHIVGVGGTVVGDGSSSGGPSTAMCINSSAATKVGSAAGEGIDAVIEFFTPSGSSQRKRFSWRGTFTAASGDDVTFSGGGCYGSTAQIYGIRVQFSSGNIASGSATLYGVRA